MASARSPADAVDALNTALVRSTQREQAGGIELLHPSGAGAVPGATASPRELLGEGVVSSAAPARRIGPSRSMLRDVRALSRRAVRSCMQAEAAMTLAGIAMHEGAAHASARHGAASGAAGGPSAPAASAQHGAPATLAMDAEQGHEEEEDDVEDEDGAVSGADEAAAAVNAHRSAVNAHRSAVNATLRLAAAAPGTAPDVAMASRAALSATYRAIRHVGQIEKDRWQRMATDGNLMAADGSCWQLMAPNGTEWQLMATDGSCWQLMATDGLPHQARGPDRGISRDQPRRARGQVGPRGHPVPCGPGTGR